MKSDTKREAILGKAVQGFDGKSDTQSTAVLKDSKGNSTTVSIGRIAVNINVAHNPAYQATDTTVSGVPSFLSKAAQIVTNKPVSAIRIYASLIVLALAVVIAGVLLYSGVRNGMTAIGRNPLAKRSITRSLLQVVIISLIVFIIGLIAVYLLLKI
jgi:F0F1-type ATP synthase membrane subunit c/vacuolar-type H+-ATPase subunit K